MGLGYTTVHLNWLGFSVVVAKGNFLAEERGIYLSVDMRTIVNRLLLGVMLAGPDLNAPSLRTNVLPSRKGHAHFQKTEATSSPTHS